ncbi:acyltransferase family protein [Phycicoccus flavus]|uniref:Acyltransferase family protein n=1 Tax=Phycicoccus flavus TaxID=2502783 RepID=A0A8T6R7T8_9MICO|nr:acyltransferase family protein [Phycicoccus flavus]NHA69936.1 acyltransferase family protein [Phycicoccus flavus]
MPRPVDQDAPVGYVPALDGLRAVAVALVIAYHVGVPGTGGGLLGVGVFFTLSGFLITTILLGSWFRSGRAGLVRFWVRRARRLLPAVWLVLLTVLAVTAVVDRGSLPAVAGQALAAFLYVANWHTIASGDSYFQRISGPGPLDHLWSLAVEEQFYLLWPVLLLLLLVLPRMSLRTVAVVTGALTAASFGLMAVLAHPGFDTTRAYEGTDTRAGGLLVGALLAVLMWQPRGRPAFARGPGRLDGWGLAGLVVIGFLVIRTDEYSLSLYRGGLLLLSLATAAVLAAVVQPASVLGRILSLRPFTWVGERSYGIYLWHLPVIAFSPPGLLADRPVVRGVLQVLATVVLAAASWAHVEEPVRRHGFRGAWHRASTRLPGTRRRVPAVLAGSVSVVVLATSALSAQAIAGGGAEVLAGGPGTIDGAAMPPLPPDAADPVTSTATSRPSPDRTRRTPAPRRTPSSPATPREDPAGGGGRASAGDEGSQSSSGRLRTRCTQVVHVGDSTSIGLVNADYLPRAADRVDARYRRVGATDVTTDVLGARSIVESYKGQANAEEAVARRVDAGYRGCWVIVMGVNEAANQYVGGVVPLRDRIDLVMRHIPSGTPVLWTTTKTLRGSGPYGDAEMQKWNTALEQSCGRYPSMRVYDWRSEVEDSWFVSDRIHYTSVGYRQRSARLAAALARAFPADGGSPPECLVRSGR